MLTKSATASSPGLVIRSFRRSDRLTWDQVQDIGHHDMTYSRAGGLSFSRVIVVFLEDGRYRARTAAVSFRHAYGDAEALRRWWLGYKPHHVLDFIEPPHVHGVSSGELLGAVRPERSVVIGQMVGLLFVASISGAIAIPILMAGKLSSPPFLVAAVLTAGVTVLCVVAAIRAPLVRLEVTPSDLVVRGLLHTSRLRRSDLLALQTVRRGQWSGWVVMARMRDGTSRPLNASASWGREGAESHLRTIRKRLPSVPVG